jgi:hypothetical protein
MHPDRELVPRSVGEIDGFIDLLRAACDDHEMNRALAHLLTLPDAERRALVHAWVSDLLIRQAPMEFTQAIACLLDDAVAEQAYAVLFDCRR